LILVGRDVPDIISGSILLGNDEGLFTKEALQNVIYLGCVPYTAIFKHINQTTVCVFLLLQKPYLFLIE
jgi:hypothetical protein